jgi:hypothetical protein
VCHHVVTVLVSVLVVGVPILVHVLDPARREQPLKLDRDMGFGVHHPLTTDEHNPSFAIITALDPASTSYATNRKLGFLNISVVRRVKL